MKKKNPVILLTGGTGYLGSNLLKQILSEGYEVIVLKRSFSNTFRIAEYLDQVTTYDIDTIDTKQIFEEHTLDIILHCATDYGRKGRDPIHTLEANLMLPLSLLELGREYGVSCFINTDTILDKRISNYSLSKRQFKDWLMSYKNDMVCVNIALEHFYGPGDDKTKFVSHMLQSLITAVPSIELTKGEQKRDFVYIDDVVQAFMTVLQHRDTFKKELYYFEIGSNKAVTIRKFVEMMKEYLQNTSTELQFGALPYREHEVMECVADTANIANLGWECCTSLEEGLQKTIQFELEQLNTNTL